jgi:CheY-like chemotaxis protein
MKILFLDDSPVSIRVMKIMLEKNGFDVFVASNAKDAYEVFDLEKPEVCIIDFNMPDVSGVEVAKHFLSLNPDVKIIMYTASVDAVIKKACEDVDVKAIMRKTFSTTELIEMINKITK